MTEMVPREDESNPVPRRMLLAIAAACALLATSSASFAYDGPTFRSGLWKFERTLETEINVKGDSAYTEIHQGSIGKIPTKETVVAHRVGDCDPPT